MKMAKASERDIEMALELSRTIEELMKGYFPDDGEKAVIFDPQDHYDCHKAIDLIFETACRGSLFRVVFGMAVVLDPRNEVVDPDSDVLELHPKHQKAIEQAEAYEQRIRELEAQRVPEGWGLVPITPTPDMLSAFDHCDVQGCQFAETFWDAMLAAAPKKEGE